MKLIPQEIQGLMIIEPDVYSDSRGYFFESFNKLKFDEIGIKDNFVQDNISFSSKDTLRGLHFQYPYDQAKLVNVLQGEVFDVAVDIRVGSPTFGHWKSFVLNSVNKLQLYIPRGFAHGFLAIQDNTIFSYKCTEFYNSKTEASILWNDEDLNIKWPTKTPLLSSKDLSAHNLLNFSSNFLPKYNK